MNTGGMGPMDSDDRSLNARTGVPGLDDVLGGGLSTGNVFLLEGRPGTGKTTIALRFLIEGAARGERGLYITLSETEHELRTVMYLVGYPNLLVSLHPDYVMTHLMTPLAVDRTHVECAWAFPKDVAARSDFDPSYAVDFWDLTNRQDWAACESVQRGLASPHARPGPLAPDEDGVYQFVTRVARAYSGAADRAPEHR